MLKAILFATRILSLATLTGLHLPQLGNVALASDGESEGSPLTSQASEVESSGQNEATVPTRIESNDSIRREPRSTFGFGVSRPLSIGKYNHYEFLYGKPKNYPSFYGGYYLGSLLLDLGIVGRIGYYNAEGSPLGSRTGVSIPLGSDLKNIAKDESQRISLSAIPIQTSLELAFAPLASRFLVLKGWFGFEYAYIQESIEPKLEDSGSNESSGVYSTAGWNTGVATGGMLSISLSGIDNRADYSLQAIGVDRIYLSLSYEIVKTLQEKMGNFDRQIIGLALSFEGLR